MIDEEIRRIIKECADKTKKLVEKHKVQIENLSEILLKKETLDLHDIVEVLGERPFAPKSNYKAYLELKRVEKIELAGEKSG